MYTAGWPLTIRCTRLTAGGVVLCPGLYTAGWPLTIRCTRLTCRGGRPVPRFVYGRVALTIRCTRLTCRGGRPVPRFVYGRVAFNHQMHQADLKGGSSCAPVCPPLQVSLVHLMVKGHPAVYCPKRRMVAAHRAFNFNYARQRPRIVQRKKTLRLL